MLKRAGKSRRGIQKIKNRLKFYRFSNSPFPAPKLLSNFLSESRMVVAYVLLEHAFARRVSRLGGVYFFL